MTEKEVENQILDWLKSVGIMAWKNQSVGIFDQKRGIYRKPNNKHHIKGTSDILGVMPNGQFLSIEVKAPLKNPRSDERLFVLASPEQQDFILRVCKSGGLAFVADRLEVVKSKIDLTSSYALVKSNQH
jgi:hypothetical protein